MASKNQSRPIPAFKIGLVLLMHLTLAKGISYVCLLPQTIRPGMDLSASVTLHRANGPVTLQLSVISNTTGSVIAKTEMRDVVVGKNPETRLMKLKIPTKLLESEYMVKVSGSINRALVFTNSTMVTVIKKTNLLFVQTDKAMYKPGQTVLFRVVAIYPTMKPCKDKMDIVINDPQKNRIAQWLQKQDEKGVVSGELALSRQTPLGTWTIEVKTAVDAFTKTFEVAEYVLPKFEVSVIAPSHYTLLVSKQHQQPSIFVTVTARYTYQQAVKGTVTLSGHVFQFDWESGSPFTVTKTANLKDGTAHFEFTTQELSYMVPDRLKEEIMGNVSAWTLLNSRSIIFSAQVNETVTGIVLSSNNSVMCHDQKYVLEFLEITPESYRHGLNYTGFLVLKQQGGEIPLLKDIQLSNGRFRGVNITLTPAWTFMKDCDETHYVVNAPLTANGLVIFQVNLNMNCNYDMEAVYEDASTGVTSRAFKKIDPFETATPVAFHVSLKETTSAIKAGDEVSFEIRSTAVIKDFFYCLMSKGEIVLTKSVSNVQTKMHMLNIKIDRALAQKLAPLMRLVVWIVAQNPKQPKMFEVISDSIQVNVEGAFVNNVTLRFDSDRVQPGDNVTLEVKASGGSNVFVLAVDQSVLLLRSGNDITQGSVLDALSSYEDNTDISRPEFFSRRWGPICLRCPWWPIFPSGQDSIEIFREAKLVCLTDGYLHRRKLFIRRRPIFFETFFATDGAIRKKGPGETAPSEKAPVYLRTKFPETWIWHNKTTGSDGVGIIKATAPDTITSWVASAFAVHSTDGLGISPIASTLTVYRPFFISLTLPYSIRRGEVFALKATVFNYFNESLTVKVTLKKSDSFVVQHEPGFSKIKDLVKTIKVKKNDAMSITLWINVTRLGEIPFEVLAQGGVAGDGERRTVLVVPEGIEQHYSTSVLIDNSKQDKQFVTNWNASLPSKEKGFVPDSASVQVTVIGDILGTALNGLESLVRVPHGCGEQLMVSTAPNVFILKSLRFAGLLTRETEDKCKKYLLSGYQAELTFQRSDGSFSAFGNGDPSGSIWLSAYVCLIFNEARNDIPIEDSKLAPTLRWIIQNQNKNGSFTEPPNGRVLAKYMQGGASKGVPLTAYVLIALINNQNNSAMNKSSMKGSISKAVHFLELQLNSLNDSYSLCIVSYALVLANSSKASLALKKRDALAIKTIDQTHWTNFGHPSPVDSNSFIPPFIQPDAVDIEMTAYALLTCTVQNDMNNCLPIAKWLIAQRNPYGGFSSTQDTVVGLQALASFASRMFGKRSSFSLRITASNGKQNHAFDPLTPKNMLTLQTWEPTEAGRRVVIKAKGLGIGLVQLNVKYNLYRLPSDRGLGLTVNPVVKDGGRQIILNICAKWTKPYQDIGMVLLMIQLPSGYSFDSIEEVDKRRGWLKKVETDYQAVSVYFDTLDKIGTCVKVTLIREYYVNNLKPSSVKLVEYYNPSNFVYTTYSVNVRTDES